MIRFVRLLRLETALFVRQPLSWAVYLALAVAMIGGGYNAGQYRDRQATVLAGITAQERQADARALRNAARYSKPSAMVVPWWKDPTDAYGYLAYNLTRYAVKPPTPLAVLAVGQSDLLPYYFKSDLMATAPEETSYDFQNPRRLGVGSFDLAFVLVYLLPLALITLSAFRLSAEHDSGTLRLIAAQPVSLRTMAAAKFGAVATVSVLAVLIALVPALIVGGIPTLDAGWSGMLLLSGLAIVAYILFWIGLSLLVVSFWRGAIISTATLVLLWIGFTALVPALSAFVLQATYPSPSRLAYTDEMRLIADRVANDKDAVISEYTAANPEYAQADKGFAKSNELSKIALQSAIEAQIAPHTRPFSTHRDEIMGAANKLRLLSPALMLDQTLQTAAGTDARRHASFVYSAVSYRDRLRAFLWPKALQQAAYPRTKACVQCPGRLAFNEFDQVPNYQPLANETVVGRVSWGALYLWMATLLVIAAALARLRRWPRQL